jgi:regulator of replication initiation timing
MSLETKRKVLELKRVETARMDLEFKIEEKLDEIERLKKHVDQQLETEERLKKEIEELNK